MLSRTFPKIVTACPDILERRIPPTDRASSVFQVVVAAEIVDNGASALIRKKFGDFNPISVHGNRCAEHLPSQAGTSAVVRINPLSQVLEKKELVPVVDDVLKALPDILRIQYSAFALS